MDLAKTLIRSVARAFYETRHVLVIDAIMVHSTYDLPPTPTPVMTQGCH